MNESESAFSWRSLGLSVLAGLAIGGLISWYTVLGSPSGATSTNHFWWYLSRASGFTAMTLLAATVCLGLAVRGRYPMLARWRWFDMHQFLSLTAMGAVGIHVLSLLGDQYIGFGLTDLLVPFAASYRPAPLAIGIVSLDLFAVVLVSFYVRRFIGYRAWRATHYGTFLLFFMAEAHGLLAGTDTGEIWAVLVYWACAVGVVALTYLRVATVDAGATPRGPVKRPTATPPQRSLPAR